MAVTRMGLCVLCAAMLLQPALDGVVAGTVKAVAVISMQIVWYAYIFVLVAYIVPFSKVSAIHAQ